MKWYRKTFGKALERRRTEFRRRQMGRRVFREELRALLAMLPEAERLATIDRIRELIFDDPTMLDVTEMLIAYKTEVMHPKETP